MMHAEKYGDKLDFSQRFMIGCGTNTEVTMDTPNEVTVYLFRDMDSLHGHFAHVYDREKLRITDGCLWRMAFRTNKDPLAEDIWHDW